MPPDKLVMMANQIGKFFVSQGRDKAPAGIADHLKKFWDPKMRSNLVAYWGDGGKGLDPEVSEAMVVLVGKALPPRHEASQGAATTQSAANFWERLTRRRQE